MNYPDDKTRPVVYKGDDGLWYWRHPDSPHPETSNGNAYYLDCLNSVALSEGAEMAESMFVDYAANYSPENQN